MTPPDYRKIFPLDDETPESYCKRLEDGGFEEMYIRKALAIHFNFSTEIYADFFEGFEIARLRHITMLRRLFPKMTPYAFHRKVTGNLGVSSEKGHYWINKFDAGGEVEYNETYETQKPETIRDFPALGRILLWVDKPGSAGKLIWLLIVVCVALFLADFTYEKHGHFEVENLPGFYAGYGFVMFTGLILVAKALRVLIKRPEDFYGDKAVDREDYPDAGLDKVDYDD